MTKIYKQYSRTLDLVNTDIFKNIKNINNSNVPVHIIVPNIIGDAHVSGFSKQLYEHYPLVEANTYVGSHKKNKTSFIELCSNQKTKAKIIVANMYFPTNTKAKRTINYGHLVLYFYQIKEYIHELKKKFPDFAVEIHSPRLGTGIFGGNWNIIAELMEDIFTNNKTIIYNYRLDAKNVY